MLCFNGKRKKTGNKEVEKSLFWTKKVWPRVVVVLVVEGMCVFFLLSLCSFKFFFFRALINGKKRSQENVEKQKGWRLVEVKEDGSDICFVCLFVKWCNFVMREREREGQVGMREEVFLFRVRGRS